MAKWDLCALLNRRDTHWQRLMRSDKLELYEKKQALLNFERRLYDHYKDLYHAKDFKSNMEYLEKYVELFPRYIGINYGVNIKKRK